MRGPDHPDVATGLNNLADLYRSEGRLAEAEPLFKRALEIIEKALGSDHPSLSMGLNNLGELYRSEGRYAEAELLYKRALTIAQKAFGPNNPEVAKSLQNLALIYIQRGGYAEAEPINKHALEIYTETLGPGHPFVALSLANLAELHRRQGKPDLAFHEIQRAVDIIARHLAVSEAVRSGAGTAEHRKDRAYFVDYIRIAYAVAVSEPTHRASITAETFRISQLAQTSGAAEAVSAMATRFAAGGDTLAAVVRERQDLSGRWHGLDADVIKAASRPPAERNAAQEAARRIALDETAQRLDALDARIAREFPGYAELSNPKPLTVEAAQSLLAGDEALLVYLTSNEETWLWVVRHDTVTFHRLNVGAAALADEVTALRARLDPDLNPKLLQYPAARAYALYQKLVGPAEALLVGVRYLLIIPDGALESLPLGVLVTRPPEHDPETPADERKIAWLARDYAVTVLPSVSALRGLRGFASAEHAPSPFFGVGDPVLKGIPSGRRPTLVSTFPGALANAEAVRGLPPLPETAEELRAIARTMGATENDLLLGARASEPVLRQTPLDHYRVVAFATHGLMSGELKGLAEPALVLTPPAKATAENDGLLTASKIATLKFNADWVVLSACNTAAGDGTPDAGGLSGLAKAFFYAGARSLLVSHWPVRSDAAVKLTTGAFAELAKDPTIGRAEALRRAMIVMLDPANPPEFAHPLAWAPFGLAGEGGAGR
jgi:CHAT domain-containing protein/Tfp pilus assembly protein PilF